eukprot:6179730-Pleurochrysis_carterae.AAC.2
MYAGGLLFCSESTYDSFQPQGMLMSRGAAPGKGTTAPFGRQYMVLSGRQPVRRAVQILAVGPTTQQT